MLKIENLCKEYPGFKLKNVSFTLPKGYIMGFIGANGSGKTTTLKSMLNIIRPDSGKVEILGKDMYKNEVELKQEIGFMLGPVDYYPKTRISKVTGVYKRFFKDWDENEFQKLMKSFNLDANKKISELSAGMRVKLGIAMALSHNAKLIILDEPTSGLDPVARDELLDILRQIIEGGERSILFSTHITSDLDKCADYITFIRRGELIASAEKDEFIDQHALVSGKKEQLSNDLKTRMISAKTTPYGFSGLMKRDIIKDSDNLKTERPNLEDIMVYYSKESIL